MKRKGLIQSGFAIIFILLAHQSVNAQTVKMIMRDSSKITVKLKTYSDEYLHTWSGNFKLSTIQSIQFAEKDARSADFFQEKLRQSGIVVFIGEERFEPLTPPEDEDPPAPDPSFKPGRDFVSPKFYEQVDPAAINVGLGFGLDYGGFGGRLTFYPGQRRVGIFATAGYALAGVGSNVGLNVRFSQNSSKLCAYGIAMYGYNAAIIDRSTSSNTKIYYGSTIGGGLEFRSRAKGKNFLNVEVLIPFRSSDFNNDYDRLKSIINISTFPVTVCIGYHFGL